MPSEPLGNVPGLLSVNNAVGWSLLAGNRPALREGQMKPG